jgi:glucose-1-phosphate thymidylyltransferase
MPKQLIPVAGVPVLGRVLRGLADIGVVEVAVVVGDQEQQVRDALGDGSRYGVEVTLVRQDAARGLAHALAVARPFLQDEDVAMVLGDNVLLGGLHGAAAQFLAGRPAAHLLLHEVEDPRRFGVAQVSATGRVLDVVEKPRDPVGNLALTGVYFFSPQVHAAVDRLRPSARGELEITDAIKLLVEDGAAVTSTRHRGYWKDVGTPLDVVECNRDLLPGLVARVSGSVDTATRVVGHVVVEAGARVERSLLHGPVLVRAGAVVRDSTIGPGTTVGAHCLVDSSTVRDSVVLDGSRLHRGTDLRGCVVGHGEVLRTVEAGTQAARAVAA